MDEARAVNKIEGNLPQGKNRLYQWCQCKGSTLLETGHIRKHEWRWKETIDRLKAFKSFS